VKSVCGRGPDGINFANLIYQKRGWMTKSIPFFWYFCAGTTILFENYLYNPAFCRTFAA
jgi:hypothetical protein